jgi:hypothetical protein
MNNLIRGEFVRWFSTRLPLWSVVLAIIFGGGITALLSLVGPENANPPMPAVDTAEGVGIVVGLNAVMLFVPALIGCVAITSEYRHRTIGTTFLAAPRRTRVLGAKLVVYGILGLGYGLASSLAASLALYAGAALRGAQIGAPLQEVATLLGQLTVTAAIYTLIGVAIGALARHQLISIGIVLGYFYFLEYLLMIVPGINTVYPYLPGGATASLTRFTFLADTIATETAITAPALLSPAVAALVLLGYAAAAATVAVIAPLQRDLA